MKKLFFILISIVISSTTLFAQKSVTLKMVDGSTKTGIVKSPSQTAKVIKYKSDKNAAVEKINSADIKTMIVNYDDGSKLELDYLPIVTWSNICTHHPERVSKPMWLPVAKRGPKMTMYRYLSDGGMFYNGSSGSSQSLPNDVVILCKRSTESAAFQLSMTTTGIGVNQNSLFKKSGPIYFSDNATVVAKIEKKEYTYKDIEKIVDIYNKKR